jgi:hypothetical protein
MVLLCLRESINPRIMYLFFLLLTFSVAYLSEFSSQSNIKIIPSSERKTNEAKKRISVKCMLKIESGAFLHVTDCGIRQLSHAQVISPINSLTTNLKLRRRGRIPSSVQMINSKDSTSIGIYGF